MSAKVWMKEGFRIGFRYADCAVKQAGSNMKSALDHPEVVEQYLATEVKLGRVMLLDREALPAGQVSCFGVIPKNQPGRWRDKLYVDTTLPFGLRSAPKIFNAVADASEWIMEHNGVRELLHYLDDFLIFGVPDSLECQQALEKALQLC